MVIDTFTLRTSLDPAECMRLLSEQSKRQCMMFGRPILPFQTESSWPSLPIKMDSDGDSFELSVDRRYGVYALRGRLIPHPAGQGTRIECSVVACFELMLALFVIGVLFLAFVPYRHRGILNCSSPEQLREEIVLIVVCGFFFAVSMALTALSRANDMGILTAFLKATAQAERA